MLLIIPAIDLQGLYCVRRTKESFKREHVYFDDPVKMARLWRIQNARALHVTGHDEGDKCNRDVLSDICQSVDIPIQLHGHFYGQDEIASALDAGAYRIVLDIDGPDNLPLFSEAINRFGPSRIVAGIHACEGSVDGTIENNHLSAIDLAGRLESAGCRRIVYSDLSSDGILTTECLESFKRLGESLQQSRITVAGGIGGFDDLMALAALESSRIDSVVIGRALYENGFPCQQFWCWNYKDELDLSRFSTATLSDDQDPGT